MRGVQGTSSALVFVAVAGFLSCREPTQITLVVTTDAGCPSAAERPRINDVVILTAKSLQLGVSGTPQLVPAVNAQTDQCEEDAGTNRVGTLVLLPEGDDSTVEVLIAVGVQRDVEDGDLATSLSAGECARKAFAGESIEGLPCIIARRRLGFIDHESLVLPIDLDRRCIGEDCGSDLTCFQGNCVPPDVVCAPESPECSPPPGCADECEIQCATGTATCVDGQCSCPPCDPAECIGNSECPLGEVGVCSEDGTLCGCAAPCNPETCDGTCVGAECIKSCEEGALCECEPDECGTVCDTATCECVPQCSASCSGPCDGNGKLRSCNVDDPCSPCDCRCDDAACSHYCQGVGQQFVSCGGDTCQCEPISSTGGGGSGGNTSGGGGSGGNTSGGGGSGGNTSGGGGSGGNTSGGGGSGGNTSGGGGSGGNTSGGGGMGGGMVSNGSGGGIGPGGGGMGGGMVSNGSSGGPGSGGSGGSGGGVVSNGSGGFGVGGAIVSP